MKLCRQGYLKVGDRALQLVGSSGGNDLDCIYTDIQIEYFDDRTDIFPPEAELMESVQVNIKEE